VKHSILNRRTIHALLAASIIPVFAHGATDGAGKAEASEIEAREDRLVVQMSS